MKKIKYSILCIGIFLCFNLSLHAERDRAFQRGDISISLNGGGGFPSGNTIDYLTNTTLYEAEMIMNITSSNQNRRIFGLMQQESYQNPIKSSRSFGFGVEFAPASFLGLGFSLNASDFEIKNVHTPTMENLLFFLTLLYPDCSSMGGAACTSSDPGLLDYMSYPSYKIKSNNIYSADFNLALHLFTGRHIDPYVRFEIGLGSVGEETTTSLGLAIGMKYVSSSGTFLNFNASVHDYTIPATVEYESSSVVFNTISVGIGKTF